MHCSYELTKKDFFMSWQIDLWKCVITDLISKSCKKQKGNILKKKLLSIILKNKEAIKEKSREYYKNLSQKKTRLKSTKEKGIKKLAHYNK